MSIEAMKQALEALESYHGYMEPLTTVFGGPRVPAEQSTTGKVEKSITALRTAIEQAEKQEPVAYSVGRTLHWHEGKGVNDARLYTTPPAAPVQEPVGRTDQQIVDQTEELAVWLLSWGFNHQPETDAPMRESAHPIAQRCWSAACHIQEMLTNTDPENSVAEMDVDNPPAAQPAPVQEPVNWREHVEQRIRTWRQRTMNKCGDMLAIDDFMGQDSIDDLVDFVCDEWAGPPAAQSAPVQEPVACDGDFPEGFDKSFGIPAQALRQANAALCEVTNNRMWDVPALAERMMLFRTHTTPPAYDQGWKDGYKHGAWANTAAPVQEPVKDRLDFWALFGENQRLRAELKFNTTPPAAQRQWVGLTEDAIYAAAEVAWRAGWAACRDAEFLGEEAENEAWGYQGATVAKDTEAKLREKNGGAA